MSKIESAVRFPGVALLAVATGLAAQSLDYPQAPKSGDRDVYHGTEVLDPYRPLEDVTAPGVLAWLEGQKRVTDRYFAANRFRRDVQSRIGAVNTFTRYSGPRPCCSAFGRGKYEFFRKQEPGQPQAVVYVQRSSDHAPEVLLDPNGWSADGTTRLGAFVPSGDAKYLVYGVTRAGSDWQEYRVLEIATKRLLPDRLEWIKGVAIGWHGDGFFYTRYPVPPAGQELTAISENHAVYYHKVGTPQSADRVVYSDAKNPKRTHVVITTDDERFALLYIGGGGSGQRGAALWVRPLATERPWVPIVPEAVDGSFRFVSSTTDALLVHTTYKAPRGRVVRIKLSDPRETQWETVIPEQVDPIYDVTSAANRLFVRYLRDVITRVFVYEQTGRLDHELTLPGPGAASGFEPAAQPNTVFYTFSSLASPDTIYRYDLGTQKSTVFLAPSISGDSLNGLETRQVFYASKDGTRIPMFLLHKRGLQLDGTNPTLLHGYGAFGTPQSPRFNPSLLVLIERGFVYALANIRGGGEYGREWHEAGRKLNRQNTFDDFISAAEWLVSQKYTSPQKLGIQGASSGGTLVATVINQRPELFRAAYAHAGVMDMLRFQKFTVGANWVTETGSSDREEEFPFLFRYSPLHNVRPGIQYPAVLVTTGDHDDRVVPAHSYKYAAAMQEQVKRERPVLLHVIPQSGHASSSLDTAMAQAADVFSFFMQEMGVSGQQSPEIAR